MNTADELAYITNGTDGVFIEALGDFNDAIQLRSAGDVIAFLTGVANVANQTFGTKIKVLTADKLNVAPYLDGVTIQAGDYPPINFDDKSYRNVADELSPLHIFGK